MKRFKSNRLVRALGIALISSASLYGIGTTPALADSPIWPVPANTADFCMADEYVQRGGSGMKDVIGEALNCTANDVEITKVDPKFIVLHDDQGNEVLSSELTCTLGDPFILIADIDVRANAAERWDTTFYIPQKEDQDPDVISQVDDACSRLIPIPDGTDGNSYVAQQLDGDACGDIAKADLTNDEYTLVGARFTMICEDEDPDGDGPLTPDGMADFNYCAAWDNIERDNCSAADGQVPNNKSKCKCDNFPIDVFVEPKPATVTKTVDKMSAEEPFGLFTYTVTIEKAKDENGNPTGADINITDIQDTYKSSDTAYPGPYYFDLDDTESDYQQGNVTLLGSSSYTAANACWRLDLSNTPITLTNSSPTLVCTFRVRIDDVNLRDVDPWDEDYYDFVSFSATDTENRGIDVGNDACDSFASDPVAGDNCSAVVGVKITNDLPSIDVSKSIWSTGADPEELTSIPEPGGTVEFRIEVKNTSGAHDSPLTLEILNDSVFGDLLTRTEGNCDTMSTSIAFNGSFTCSFTETLTGNFGDQHYNKVTGVARDATENQTATDPGDATLLFSDVDAMIELTKTPDVDSVLETGDNPTLYRTVNYTFEFTNTSLADYVTFFKLTDQEYEMDGGTKVYIGSLADITADCIVDGTPLSAGIELAPGASASCVVAITDIQGNTGEVYRNEAVIYGFDDDHEQGADDLAAMAVAQVGFTPDGTEVDMDFATSMLVVLQMENGSEANNVNFTGLTVKLQSVFAEAETTEFKLLNSGGVYNEATYGYCEPNHVLGYLGSGTHTYSCAFTIELKPGLENNDDINFAAALVNGIVATFTDPDVPGEPLSNAVAIQVITDEPNP
ncbi:hypothetical protein K0J45_08345 [Shewanella alkalitolerans]|uniref:hypothetical protein n=1 Tax=Shewanella alkalitolerans TaxID=2864209 RepID=UPI001C65837C|nr:hypothetical protein [Shewanella alkalitolerans]QYJ99193.1 hypothetical protein K0J45_08345 [Shewanella alkalitolerans]